MMSWRCHQSFLVPGLMWHISPDVEIERREYLPGSRSIIKEASELHNGKYRLWCFWRLILTGNLKSGYFWLSYSRCDRLGLSGKSYLFQGGRWESSVSTCVEGTQWRLREESTPGQETVHQKTKQKPVTPPLLVSACWFLYKIICCVVDFWARIGYLLLSGFMLS